MRKQNEWKKEIKQNERMQKRQNIREEGIDLGRLFELATSNKIYVKGLYLHEIKKEILLEYKGAFEWNGSMVIGPVQRKTIIRFKIGTVLKFKYAQ